MRFDARKGAELARLKLTEDEVEKLQQDLDEIAEIVSSLLKEELGSEPMYTPSEAANVARLDEPGEPLGEGWLYLPPYVEEVGGNKYVKAPRP